MKCIEKGLDPNTMRKQEPRPPKNKGRKLKYVENCLLKYEGAGPNATWEIVRVRPFRN